jgi:Flp pilus assembly protein TadG
MVLELAIAFTVLIVMLLAIVGFGRITYSRQLVNNAAAVGARAAVLADTPAAATTAASTAVSQTLARSGLSCQNTQVDVDTSQFLPGGQVSVQVRCTADLSALALSGMPSQRVLNATSRAPMETHRDFTGKHS